MTENQKYETLRNKMYKLIKIYRLVTTSDMIMVYNAHYKTELTENEKTYIRNAFRGRRFKFKGNKNYRHIRG